jgi:hypothetical protein
VNRRVLKIVLAVVSLLLCICAAIELWSDSRQISHLGAFSLGSRYFTLDEFQGSIYFTSFVGGGYSINNEQSLGWFRIGIQCTSPYWRATTIAVPYWVPALLVVIKLSLRRQIRWRWTSEKRPASDQLCRDCGYDLRATPDRCPECGAMTRSSQ